MNKWLRFITIMFACIYFTQPAQTMVHQCLSLFEAAQKAHPSCLERYLQEADTNISPHEKIIILNEAAPDGLPLLFLLVLQKPNNDFEDARICDCIRMLVNHGADPDKYLGDNCEVTPRSTAQLHKKETVLKALGKSRSPRRITTPKAAYSRPVYPSPRSDDAGSPLNPDYNKK